MAPGKPAGEQPVDGSEQDRDAPDRADGENDRGAAGQALIVGEQEAGDARHDRDEQGDRQHRLQPRRPKTCGSGGQHHQTDRHQRAERVEAADKVQDDQAEKQQMDDGPEMAGRPQKGRIETFDHKRPVDQSEDEKGENRDCGQQ